MLIRRLAVLGAALGTLVLIPTDAQAQWDRILRRGAEQIGRQAAPEIEKWLTPVPEDNVDDGGPKIQQLPEEPGKGNNQGPGWRRSPGWGDPWRSQPQRPPQQQPRYTPSQPSAPVERGNGKPIKLSCPKDQNGQISYTLLSGSREFPITLKAGYKQNLKTSTVWRIRYRGSRGATTYRLRGGNNYVFKRDSRGSWQLYKRPQVKVEEEPPALPL